MKGANSMARHESADLCVVGSGLAGMTAALTAAEQGARVLLITSGEPLSGSSRWAQGGIAAAVGPEDAPEAHVADTLAVGAGLNDRAAVEVLVRDGQREVFRLLASGVPFDGGSEHPELGLEAGHHQRRILHAGGGATGERVSAALLARVVGHPQITLIPETPISALLQDGARVTGVASGLDRFYGRGVVLATGGYAGLWGRTTNPPENRGVALALAWQVGASLADLEFVQFHPTALLLPGGPTYLLSEALRGEGALLVDAMGQPVMNPLLARDVVARAVARHLQEQGPVYLSLRHLDPAFVVARFPNLAAQLHEWGLDLARDLLPVAPAAHYCMGGVRTDTEGRTDVPGLYVAGEAACTGAQGANRLASNSMLECVVFGTRAAQAALTDTPERHAAWRLGPLPADADALPAASGSHRAYGPLGARLDRDLGVERDAARLGSLVADLPDPLTPNIPVDHLAAGLVARAALLRHESRGAHYRTDAPATQPVWQGRIHWRRNTPPQFEEVLI
jgi:L-aspartate oxidase